MERSLILPQICLVGRNHTSVTQLHEEGWDTMMGSDLSTDASRTNSHGATVSAAASSMVKGSRELSGGGKLASMRPAERQVMVRMGRSQRGVFKLTNG
jgi:hypothetical protein